MSYDTDMNVVVKRALAQGFTYDRTTKGHYRFYAPNKKDIIIAAGSSVNHEAWEQFMAKMRHAGYHHTGNGSVMSEAFKAAQVKTNEEEKKPPFTGKPPTLQQEQPSERGSLTDRIREFFFKNQTNIFSIEEVFAVIRSHDVSTTKDRVGITLARLVKQDELVRKDKGTYQYRSTELKVTQPNILYVAVQTKPSAPAEDTADEDEKELDEALAALGKIESVVRKHKGIARQLAELRKLLGVKAS